MVTCYVLIYCCNLISLLNIMFEWLLHWSIYIYIFIHVYKINKSDYLHQSDLFILVAEVKIFPMLARLHICAGIGILYSRVSQIRVILLPRAFGNAGSFLSITIYSFSRASITQYHRIGDLHDNLPKSHYVVTLFYKCYDFLISLDIS